MENKNWRKANRMNMLKVSFLLFWPGFAFAYLGGVNNNPLQIGISFVLLGIAALLALLIK